MTRRISFGSGYIPDGGTEGQILARDSVGGAEWVDQIDPDSLAIDPGPSFELVGTELRLGSVDLGTFN